MQGVHTVSFWVPGGRTAAYSARHSVLSAQVGLSSEVRHRLALLLSELVNNATQHGGADAVRGVRVRVASSERHVRIEVEDPGSEADDPALRVTAEGGWGLLLVDRLADAWGREAAGDGGTVVWFELAREAQAA